VLLSLLLTGFAGQVHKLEGEGTSKIGEGRGVIHAPVFFSWVVNADQGEKLVGENSARISVEIKPIGNVAALSFLV
jgi:hypothetical protein